MDFSNLLSTTFLASAEYHETIGSTNDRARECANEDVPLPRLIVAGRQTAGRGRGSNRWWTGLGSLAMSLLLPATLVPRDVKQSVLLSLTVGVALVDALRQLLPEPSANQIALHWPNDVMLADRKIAGILIEALPNRAHVVGIGVNTNNTAVDAPDELVETVATLQDVTDTSCDHELLLLELMRQLETALRELTESPETVAARANERCSQRGLTLSVRQGDGVITGQCRGIGSDGALLLDTPAGSHACYSGIVGS